MSTGRHFISQSTQSALRPSIEIGNGVDLPPQPYKAGCWIDRVGQVPDTFVAGSDATTTVCIRLATSALAPRLCFIRSELRFLRRSLRSRGFVQDETTDISTVDRGCELGRRASGLAGQKVPLIEGNVADFTLCRFFSRCYCCDCKDVLCGMAKLRGMMIAWITVQQDPLTAQDIRDI